jgi:DNA-binding IclR family transcriptional regulator
MSSYKRIESVKVAVSILRHLAKQQGPVSGQDVAKAVGVPPGTVMCHLATLEDEGMVRSVGGAYEMGMGMALFWARYKSALEGTIERLQGELKQLN